MASVQEAPALPKMYCTDSAGKVENVKTPKGAPNNAQETTPRQGIGSVEVGMKVLQALEQGRGPMSLTDIAAHTEMSASRVHRYLVSFSRVGLASQAQNSGLYDLGPAMRRLGIEALRRMNEVGIASEHISKLRDQTAHTVNLAVWGDTGPIVVRWEYGAYALPITIRLGATMPLLSSSLGRIFLAYLPATMTEPILEKQAREQATMPPLAEVKSRREAIRASGFTVTSGSIIPGVTSIAAPIHTAGDSTILAASVVLPEALADESTIQQLQLDLKHTARDISLDLGMSLEDFESPR